jgi:SAM-dependent methyltransferase
MDSECSDILTELESWYGRESGHYLLQSTAAVVQGLLDTSFGYHILQIGVTRGQALFEGSPINHRIYASHRCGQSVTLVCDCDELPLESDSVDAVIAHHSLEFTAHPHQVLREIQRVLTPQGQLLVIGFNPYSIAGLGQYLRRVAGSSLWRPHRPVSERRLTDWLHLLDCEVQATTRLYTVPPIGGNRLRGWLTRADQWGNRHNLPLGGLYVLQAIKQQPALHRRRRHLRLSSGRLMGLAVPKPKTAPSPTPTAPVHRKPIRPGGDVAA